MADKPLKDIPNIEKLKSAVIPNTLICKDLATNSKGNALSNYEDWARELINNSSKFMEKTHGESFKAPNSEAHGECDAVSSTYQIDFKLILGQSRQRAIRETSIQCVIENTSTYYFPGRAQNPYTFAKLRNVLRGRSKESLQNLLDEDKVTAEATMGKQDIRSFLKSIKHNKHLLLIMPEVFFTSDGKPFPQEIINECLSRDFGNSLALRRDWYPSQDTYLAYFYEGRMVILQYSQMGLEPFDSVPITKSPTFITASEHCDYFTNPQLSILLSNNS